MVLHQDFIFRLNFFRQLFFVQHIPQIYFDGSSKSRHGYVVDKVFKWIFTIVSYQFHGQKDPGYYGKERNSQPNVPVSHIIKFSHQTKWDKEDEYPDKDMTEVGVLSGKGSVFYPFAHSL